MRIPTALLLKLALDIRASYWFIPALLVVVAIFLALALSWVDRHPARLPVSLPDFMLDTQVNGARAVLSVIATAVIGVAGVMFSVTIVAVSFASGKYGPRLIGNFMRDRGNQWSLGILISTFVYALLVLREVQSGGSGDTVVFVPQYSLWVAILLALMAVATMIYFVHHIPETINVSRITASLGRKLCAAAASHDLKLPEPSGPEPRTSASAPATEIFARSTGYIQTVDIAGMVDIAKEHEAKVTLIRLPGTFVTLSDPIVSIATSDVSAATKDALADTVALGDGPTEDQNSAFLAQQLVEMVARALSPGVNDPFTAINCLNWLYAGLVQKAQNDKQMGEHPLINVPTFGFDELLDASFAASLPYAKTDELVIDHVKSLLSRLRDHASGSSKAAVTRLLKTI
jgi:uncharacterized membrane protein